MKRNKPKMFKENSLKQLREHLDKVEATIEWKYKDDVDHTWESVIKSLIVDEIKHRTGDYDPPF